MNDDKQNQLSRVYSEGAWPEPRRQIDDAILEASRRAARARHPMFYRWATPFALAATVVLAFTLAVFVSEQESGREARALLGAFNYTGEKPAAAPEAKRRAEPASAPKAESAPAPAQPKPGAAASKPAAPPPLAKQAAPKPGDGYAAKAPAVVRAQPQGASADPARADRVRRELEQLDETRQLREAAPRDLSQPQRELQAQPDAASLPGPRRATAPESRLSSAPAASTVPAAARAPDAWLEDIRKLKAQGRSQDVERELAEFRKRYPDYRVPDDLR